MASPIGHITAILLGACVPVMYGMTAVWQDHWQPEAAVELIAREGCTFTFSATPFLHGLVHAANANRDTLRSFRLFGCGGAPIPRELIRRAEDQHGFQVAACYGSSEALLNSATTADAPREKRYSADGRVLEGVEARVVDSERGTPCAGGRAGRALGEDAGPVRRLLSRPGADAGRRGPRRLVPHRRPLRARRRALS